MVKNKVHIKKDNIFQVHGYNNCLPLLKKSQYEIIRINILDQKKDFFASRVDFQKYSHSLCFLNKNDFYNKYDPYEVTILDMNDFIKYRDSSVVEPQEKRIYNSNLNYYEKEFSNVGGLVMPIILELQYEDSTNYIIRIPAEIWRKNRDQITKVFATKKLVRSFNLDPQLETADINLLNNNWPRKMIKSKFELYKNKKNIFVRILKKI